MHYLEGEGLGHLQRLGDARALCNPRGAIEVRPKASCLPEQQAHRAPHQAQAHITHR
jgi:hypothetical protein